ncbi:COP1-interactive protein 1 [Sesamum alatum]|uniref:COP1-interactive protein 1 n=1 Tax=Sesamum alatum TaxID=300844 RepID=A0AAE1YSR4_9LAMI|nr:COP1-interactive protein 1 [Sesamum alatum]
MARRRWKGSLKPFSNHIDPEKEEQLNWMKIETENQVKRILKLTKNLNHGNKERNSKKKLEVVQLIEDVQKQYESLYSLYEDLRETVKKKVGRREEDCSSTYNSDSEAYYSSGEFTVRRNKFSSYAPKMSDTDESDSSDLEGTILKDKLTSSSEVKRTINLDTHSAFGKPLEFGEIVKDLKVQGEESEKVSQRLDQIKDLEGQVASLKLENSTLYMQKRELEEHLEYSSDQIMQTNEKMSQRLAQIKDLEGQVTSLKRENSTLYTQKRELEEHLEDSAEQIVQMNEKITRLEPQIMELEATAKENECLVTQANDMQLQLTIVEHEKDELEGRLEHESKQRSSQVKALWEQVNSLQQELASVNSQKEELELELKRKMKETSECLLQIEGLRNELMSNEKGVKDLELEIHTLSSKKSYLEEQVEKMNHEVFQSNVEKEKLHGKISDLQIALSERENELSTEQKKFESCQNIMSMKIKSLTEEVEILRVKLDNMQHERDRLVVDLGEFQNEQKQLQMELEREKQESSLSISQVEKMNAELTNKVAHQQKTLLELEAVISELKDENADAQTKLAYCKSNFPVVERKVDEMAEEFRKQCEDKYRILSRRIRVAEQLQVENKEWYRKTKDSYEQENKDLKERLERTENGVKNVKEMTLTANDMLTSLDSMALKFEECTANFLNRISKASCELKFAKDWAMRKNRALLHVKDDLDCLLAQLDDKEAEILVFREKFWKSENKVRELEKMMKEKEDAMLGFKEEKREAIRQLCVWIDYHRGRSDYYKKMVSDMNTGRRRAS